MRILITGAAGFLGKALVSRLIDDGCFIPRAVSRHKFWCWPAGVESVQINELGSDTDWIDAITDVNVIIHAAARVHVMKDDSIDPLAEYRHVNVAGTLTLARQAAKAGVRRFIYISSIKVNGEYTEPGRPFCADDRPAPEDAYAVSKQEAEQGLLDIAHKTGMEVVIIRPPLVYGPGVKANFATMMNIVAKGIPLPLGAVRKNRRSLIALDNLVDLVVTSVDHPAAANQVFLASDGEDLSTAELVRRLAQAMNRSANLIPVPSWLLRAAAGIIGKQAMAQRLLDSLQVDISKTRELLGWMPPVSVDEGLRRAVAPVLADK